MMANDARVGKKRWVAGAAALIMATGWASVALAHQVLATRAYTIPTNSMAPTIRAGHSVQVEAEPPGRHPRRGEIWVFRPPGVYPRRRTVH